MREIDIATQSLAMLKARDDILGSDIAALGENSWILLLQMFVGQTSGAEPSKLQLHRSSPNPRITERVIDILIDRNFIQKTVAAHDKTDFSYRLTQQTMSKIRMILSRTPKPER